MTRVAALYVDVARGPYAAMPDVDAWGVERDATRYAGPWPVVSHPPCGPWSRLKHLCGPELRAQKPLGPIAVEQVRRWGGVLEHPAGSGLFDACRMPRPFELPDAFGGWTVEVEQVRWGHPAVKRTWLYVVGTRTVGEIPPWREPTHVVTSSRHRCDHPDSPPRVRAGETHLTPPAFARWLVDIAASCAVREHAA